MKTTWKTTSERKNAVPRATGPSFFSFTPEVMDTLRLQPMVEELTDQNRESRYLKSARLAYGLTQAALPTYAHPRSPHYFTLPQLAACVLLAGHFGMSHRAMTEWLQASQQVCEILELPRVPDHSTLSRTKQKVNRKLLQWLSRRLREQM